MLTKNKRRHEINEFDFDLDLPLKLKHGTTKLKSCLPGVWRFTGTRKILNLKKSFISLVKRSK
jgi:hypothetical protein